MECGNQPSGDAMTDRRKLIIDVMQGRWRLELHRVDAYGVRGADLGAAPVRVDVADCRRGGRRDGVRCFVNETFESAFCTSFTASPHGEAVFIFTFIPSTQHDNNYRSNALTYI